jgi:hypothetical protein
MNSAGQGSNRARHFCMEMAGDLSTPSTTACRHDEELRQWLERYITNHPHHPTAVLSRYQFIGYAKRALDAYLAETYFLPQEEGGEGADPNQSGIDEAIRGFRQQIEGVERHGYLGMFVETSAWKYLRHACDTAINEQAIVVCYGRPGVGKTRCLLEYVVQIAGTDQSRDRSDGAHRISATG